MRKFGGVVLTLAGIAVAVYFGLVVLFVGGIEEIVNGATSNPPDNNALGWGSAKLVVLSPPVMAIGAALLVVGLFLIGWSYLDKFRPAIERFWGSF